MSSTATTSGADAETGLRAAPLALLAAGVCFYLLRATDWFTAVPGDLGDARFNSVVLEHLFQWLRGDVRSLWSPPFFYPAKGALAFSDNHFGSGLVYVLFRLLGFSREGAFDGWFVTGCGLNFLAMYVVLRRLAFSSFAASVGAFVYAFSLPAMAQEGHAQLTWRFAIPFASLALLDFARERRMAYLARLAAWGTLQFYCSIYLGVFMGYLLAVTAVALLIPTLRPPPLAKTPGAASLAFDWRSLAIVALCAAATGYLLLKYFVISQGYEFSRSEEEIMSMLPRPQSYLLADGSPAYRWLSNVAAPVPMRHEQQMFFGFVPLLLSCLALLATSVERRRLLGLCLAALVLLVVATLHVDEMSLYQLAMALPGISSLRAVSRIALVMALPVAVVCAIGVDCLERRRNVRWLVCSLIVIAFSLETMAYQPAHASFVQWRDRQAPLAKAAEAAPMKNDSVLYVTGRTKEPFYMTELDAMVFAQDRKVATLNGYSGNSPPGYLYPTPCAFPLARVYSLPISQLASQDLTPDALLARTVWLPLEECTMPHTPTDAAAVPPDDAQAQSLKLSATATEAKPGELAVVVRIRNSGAQTLHSSSRVGHPLRLSWRFVPQAVAPSLAVPGWNGRQDLIFSLPAGEAQEVQFTTEKPEAPGAYDLQISMVAERYKHLHDQGMQVAHVPVHVVR